jgi:hypothetical protein
MAVSLSALCISLPLPPGRFLLLISLGSWVDPRAIMRLEILGKPKISTLLGLKTATFKLVAQSLNHLCYCMPILPLIKILTFTRLKNLLCCKIFLTCRVLLYLLWPTLCYLLTWPSCLISTDPTSPLLISHVAHSSFLPLFLYTHSWLF